MEIEHTPIYREVQTILGSGVTSANLTWNALIHYGTNGETYSPLAVMSLNTSRDYVSNYGDVVTLTVMMPLGDYARLIYPNRVGLEVTLTQQTLLEFTDSVDANGKSNSERYSAVLIDQDRSPTVGQGQEVNDIDSLNLTQILEVHFQIYDKAFEQLRVVEVGGLYRTCKVSDVITTLLTNAVQAPKVSAERAIEGVDMVVADNKDVKGQLVIPHGVHLFDVADFIQARYGVYNAGLGSYLQNKTWFVYPLYDTTEFHQRKQTITFFVLPKRKFANIERTYDVNGNSITVLVTGETGFKDDSGTNYVNAGNGVRFTSAPALMERPVTTGGNKATIKRDSNNNEFVAGDAVGVNNAPTSARRITANPFVAYSELAAKNGGMLRVVWQNSDATLITPGMAVKVIYMDGENIVAVYGIVHRTNHISHKYAGFGNPRFKNQTVVDLFINAQVSEIVC